MWLWHDPTGVVVSLAGRNPTLAGVARLGPVYTPPQHRRRGYGTAITAACTRDALRGGAHHVVLFTDLANPTSNALYQRLGYRPVSDRTITTFTSSRPPATCWVMRGACVVPECDSQPITPYGPGPEREPSVSHAAHTPYPRPGRRDVPALRLTNITCHQSRLLTSS